MNFFFSPEKCISEVKDRMNINRLKLNEEKTEVVLINPEKYDVDVSSLKIGDEDIMLNDKAKNLDIFLDKNLTINSDFKFIKSDFFRDEKA